MRKVIKSITKGTYEEVIEELNLLLQKDSNIEIININYQYVCTSIFTWVGFYCQIENDIPNIKDIINLVTKMGPDYIYKDDYSGDGDWIITSEWLVGRFAGRGFTGRSKEQAAEEMCKYFDQTLKNSADSLVGDILKNSGWPDLEKVKKFVNQE